MVMAPATGEEHRNGCATSVIPTTTMIFRWMTTWVIRCRTGSSRHDAYIHSGNHGACSVCYSLLFFCWVFTLGERKKFMNSVIVGDGGGIVILGIVGIYMITCAMLYQEKVLPSCRDWTCDRGTGGGKKDPGEARNL